MAVTAKEFMENFPAHLAAAEAAKEPCSRPGCTHKASYGRTIDNKDVCDDCYFEYLGDLVEQHPIGRGRPHGGCVAGDD